MDAVREFKQQPVEADGSHVRADYQARSGPTQLKVWIDQDLCTGDGLCTDLAPAVFLILEDGIAYCRQGDQILNDPGGSAQMALVPPSLENDVIHAAGDCPGECIFIELEEIPELEA